MSNQKPDAAELIQDFVDAFRRYEMDVANEGDVPYDHREMMRRAEEFLA